MSTFWLIYWITLGIVIIFSLFAYVFFDMEEKYDEHKPISFAYVMLAIMVGAIPGANCIGAVVLIGLIIVGACGGGLVPKENLFGEKDE